MKASPVKKVVWFARSSLLVIPGLTTDDAAYRREMKRLEIEHDSYLLHGSGATTHLFKDGRGGDFALVCINPQGRTIAEVAALVAHECAHIWQYSKKLMRETSPGEEVEAYAIQWLVLQIMCELYPRGKR